MILGDWAEFAVVCAVSKQLGRGLLKGLAAGTRAAGAEQQYLVLAFSVNIWYGYLARVLFFKPEGAKSLG